MEGWVLDRVHSHTVPPLHANSVMCTLLLVSAHDCLIGLVVRRRLESGRSWVPTPLAPGIFRGRVIPVTQKLALQCLPCQAPGDIGSVLGLVSPVSVYCDWMR